MLTINNNGALLDIEMLDDLDDVPVSTYEFSTEYLDERPKGIFVSESNMKEVVDSIFR
jgi:hypothetical protein